MPWVKLYTEILDDAKLGQLSDLLKWRFVQLLVLAGECDQDGWLVQGTAPMTVEQIAWRLRVDVKCMQSDLAALIGAGLMHFERKLGAYCVSNFEKRQGRPQSQKRELWREQKHRQRRVRAVSGRTGGEDISDVRRPEEEGEEEEDKDQEGEGETGAGAPPPEIAVPAAVKVFLANGGRFQSGELVDGTSKKDRAISYIAEHVKNTPESLALWGKVVYGYCAQWSPKSYTVMVNDYYLRGRVPGQANGNGHKSHGTNGARPDLKDPSVAARLNAELNPNKKGFTAAQ